ncbi:MAG: protease, partial [Chloroflexota bacterium]|nr:protease [Chloroflexota bacterium]
MCNINFPVECKLRISVTAVALFLAFAGAIGPEQAQAQRSRFLHQPDVSASHIVFVYANDLWVVARNGSNAMRLTTFEGSETHPIFSDDGQWIAFSGQYGGNTDIYVIPAVGGEPKRLTWHPGTDVVQGWTPDGNILFRSSREAVPTRYSKFYTVLPSGGLPTPLALPTAYQGTMSADGEYIAYQETPYWDPEWRNYRGGQAKPVGIVSTSTWERRTVPWKGESQMQPTWMDGLVYYLSERDWATNLWSFDPHTGEERQLTQHADFDVKSFGAGAGVLVYEQAGYLHEVNPNTGHTKRLEIQVAGDLNWSRPRWEEVPPSRFQNFRLSPTGKRALFEWRGEIFSVPAKEGSWRNLTHSPGVADRSPTWSPDGSSIAWFNDSGGEYGLVISNSDGSGTRRIEFPSPSFYFQPEWSPDSKKLAFADAHHRVLVMNVESGDVTHIAKDQFGHPARSIDPAWSPDSRWFSYVTSLDNRFRSVFIFDTESGDSHQLTDDTVDASTPLWDESGKYLYFLASTSDGIHTA